VEESELKEIRSRCEATQKGPWVSYVEGRDQTSGSSFIMTGPQSCRGADLEVIGATTEDQDFIAHAKQDVPRLLEEIYRLRALINVTG
jgi:hypothetical protein